MQLPGEERGSLGNSYSTLVDIIPLRDGDNGDSRGEGVDGAAGGHICDSEIGGGVACYFTDAGQPERDFIARLQRSAFYVELRYCSRGKCILEPEPRVGVEKAAEEGKEEKQEKEPGNLCAHDRSSPEGKGYFIICRRG